MKYFYDTEFIECWKKPISWLPTIGNFNKPYHSIQLVSIGIVCEDGREYYAVSNEFNLEDASDWVKENVYPALYDSLFRMIKYPASEIMPTNSKFSENGLWRLAERFGKPNKQIAEEVKAFCTNVVWKDSEDGSFIIGADGGVPSRKGGLVYSDVELYGYYSDYDHVILASLFGTMENWPKGWPKHTVELNQLLEAAANKIQGKCVVRYLRETPNFDFTGDLTYYSRLATKTVDLDEMDFEKKLEFVKTEIMSYPKPANEHHALKDAKWNKKLYDFIQAEIKPLFAKN